VRTGDVWWGWAAPGLAVLVGALVWLSVIDVRTHRLPRRIIYAAALTGLPWLVVSAWMGDEPGRLRTMAAGGVGALVVFLVIYVAARGSFGDGDVRLAPLLGAYLGFVDAAHVVVGLFLGFVLASVTGVALMLAGRAGRRTALPFGPFMAAGALVTLAFGEPLVRLVARW
jgi:leader peptidase (prepilin peptidase)/N-methyltransferase